jgi:glycosyltransferase involved in cell wall biosynthesis
MKLLFISQFIARPDQAGQNRIYDFLQRLASHGHEPHVVTCGVHYLTGKIDPELAGHRLADTRWGDVRVTLTYASPDHRRSLAARLRSFVSFLWFALRAALRVGRVDAVMVSIQPMFVAPIAWVLARARGVPFILEVRDMWPDVAVELGMLRSRVLIALCRVLERFVYRSADHIIVIGPEMKRLVAERGADPARIDVIPQGYKPLPPAGRSIEETRSEYGLPDGFIAMYTGSFGVANNDLSMVLDAAARLRDVPELRFVLVGDGNRRNELVERCRREGLDRVHFVPMVPETEIPALLAVADVCIMTLPPGEFWKICFQNKVFNYLGNGRPVVAAVAGDQETLIREADGGIVVPPGDLDAFCSAIVALKNDPALRRRLGDNARTYVREHLMRDELLERYVALLEKAVSSA